MPGYICTKIQVAVDKPPDSFRKNTGMVLFLAREILSVTGITIAGTDEPEKEGMSGIRFQTDVSIIFPGFIRQ